MELKSLIAKLHPLERKVLPFLAEETAFSRIVIASGLKEVEVMRALQWLENKNVLKLNTEKKKLVYLDFNGKKYSQAGLPEKRLLSALTRQFKSLKEVAAETGLDEQEINACLGLLKSKSAIDIKKERELFVKLGLQGKKFLDSLPEERFLEKKFPLAYSSLKDSDLFALESLLKRKNFLKVEEAKEFFVELSDLGKKLIKADLGEEAIGRLTPELLKTGRWKTKKFRAYDLEINVPKIYPGKKHFVNQALEYAKQVWLDMGFKEMTGNLVNASFWNFDALFTAQDHPVRELQDTFYLGNELEKGKLPDQKLVRAVKEMHETGSQTGSKGWQYSWDPEDAKRNVLRTHTTVLSAQALAQLKEQDLPAKFFALGKCFRNEALDWSHLFEFNQTEGIVVDQKANFRHLLGYLKQFFKKMGFPQARFRPAYFPYTEPSVEIDVYHPVHKKWVELGGAGLFRPEVVIPLLGRDILVLAWGPGFDRLILDYYQIQDIRDLYKNDLKQLREIKAWLK